MNWQDVLTRNDLIGGDMESIEDGIPYRGPITSIEEKGTLFYVHTAWCAKLENGQWVAFPNANPLYVNKDVVTPNDIGDGRIHFRMPYLGRCTLFPKGGSKLESSQVQGLPKASERLLALYPDLRFDREIAGKLLTEKSWPRQAEALSKLAPDATLRDLLATFKHDSSAEEFLWYYIEAVTDEKDVHHKVY